MKIEKGVPMPRAERGENRWGFLFSCEVGDSFTVSEDHDRQAALMYAKRLGGRVVSRKIDGGYRIWIARVPARFISICKEVAA